MAYKFPGTFGNAFGNGMEQRFVECPGDLDAQRSVSGYEAFVIDGAMNFLAKVPRMRTCA